MLPYVSLCSFQQLSVFLVCFWLLLKDLCFDVLTEADGGCGAVAPLTSVV